MNKYPDGTIMRSFKISPEAYEWLQEKGKKNYRDATVEAFVIFEEAYERSKENK